MIPVKLSYIAETLGWQHFGEDVEITQVTTDSRQVKSGDCFIALYGDNFDAHQFIDQVVTQGAGALIVSQQQQVDVPQLVVEDTRVALGQLAKLVCQLSSAKKIAITGSCGKTTVKEMLFSILSCRGKVLATAGNFNNDIGAPLTLLRLTGDEQYAVIELGANHIGEIDYTSSLVEPDVAMITNIGAAHLEGFGGIEGVVIAKSEIYNHLASDGTAIFDFSSDYAKGWLLANQQRKISRFLGEEPDASLEDDVFYPSDVLLDTQGKASFTLHALGQQQRISLALPGIHNVSNALASAAAAIAVGASLADIALGLANMREVGGRLNVLKVNPLLTVIDDTYNANATSITAAIQLLGSYQGYRILVLGEMGELGEYAVASHQSLGPVIEQHNIDLLLTFGELSQHYGTDYSGEHHHFTDKQALDSAVAEKIKQHNNDNITLLAKGSRSTKMESVVQFISSQFSEGEC
ncbi:UDP-N-acetylmuramoyl-tripeptide--D-alanyl-D-alanine ligase [Psychrobium sp. 1_MG-2023]|uniref:UDP-N-acetylmuramoyl-tripeptide--D-alanyl-D- alanine ligase n=1 Tax=Psychrobium sp. 1_MG-2023 TaxID=3062624 RepID=UPI000C34C1E9|nr:UDP-N-acetylmuramoyl-tripeptide--D-alanyl-D-alanine ligase [Psychrobium sp. 1_MG-2023]MDP2561458.1 UDP-N-acetylmuramoyl-tripeptide--D-alanyl-D-alanine ligase [Psychrobium sp. 1_MG-2023]PKF57725.1 UDP-N-acetylmuramoyl-tripeptide--D-alanyl-D-alanine ligase [Alteromonadales bacterium alter-6D02]